MAKFRVDVDKLRAMFNDGRFRERAAEGSLFTFAYRDNPVPEDALPDNCPLGTRSQEVHYFDARTRQRVAIVHQYVRPDGTIGASGLPDPKYVVVGTDVYHL